MSKFLVTGGAGFIGSALTRGLLARGAEKVVVVDNLLTGHERNMTEVRGAIDFRNVDIRDYDGLRAAMQGVEDRVPRSRHPVGPAFHQRPCSLPRCERERDVQRAAGREDAGVRRVIYAASSSAYGDSLTLPKVETMQAKSEIALRRAEAHGGVLYVHLAILLRPRTDQPALL